MCVKNGMISDWWEGMNGFKMEGWVDGPRDWWTMGGLKWEETDWCYLLAMLHTVLGQHTAQCLYPFILRLSPASHFGPFLLPSYLLSSFIFTFLNSSDKFSEFLLSLTLSLLSHSSFLLPLLPPQHLSFSVPINQIFCLFYPVCPCLSICHLQWLVWVSGIRRDRHQSVSEISQLKSHDTMRHGRSLLLSRNWQCWVRDTESKRRAKKRCAMCMFAWMNV